MLSLFLFYHLLAAHDKREQHEKITNCTAPRRCNVRLSITTTVWLSGCLFHLEVIAQRHVTICTDTITDYRNVIMPQSWLMFVPITNYMTADCPKPLTSSSLRLTRWHIHSLCDVINVGHIRPLLWVRVDTCIDQLAHLQANKILQLKQIVLFSNDRI